MLLLRPYVTIRTSHQTMSEYMEVIEEAGRTCWKSEPRREAQIQKLLNNPEFDPGTYEDWLTFHPDDLGSPGKGDGHHLRIERAADKVRGDFIRNLVKVGHESVIEHSAITVRIITDRAVTHQIIRHRLGAYSQESQRYVDYEKTGHVAFIMPRDMPLEPGYYRWDDGLPAGLEGEYRTGACLSRIYMDQAQPDGSVPCRILPEVILPQHRAWLRAVQFAEESYLALRELKMKPEDARSVLPNATKTEIVVTYNVRQWRHVLKTRLTPKAQHDIRDIMLLIRAEFRASPLAILFDDINA